MEGFVRYAIATPPYTKGFADRFSYREKKLKAQNGVELEQVVLYGVGDIDTT